MVEVRVNKIVGLAWVIRSGVRFSHCSIGSLESIISKPLASFGGQLVAVSFCRFGSTTSTSTLIRIDHAHVIRAVEHIF